MRKTKLTKNFKNLTKKCKNIKHYNKKKWNNKKKKREKGNAYTVDYILPFEDEQEQKNNTATKQTNKQKCRKTLQKQKEDKQHNQATQQTGKEIEEMNERNKATLFLCSIMLLR